MTAPTQPVTCRFFGQDGEPVAAKVSFRLTVQDTYNGLIVSPEIQYVTCDALTGIGVIDLFPNALGANSSQYTVKAWDTVTGRKILDTTLCTVPDSPCYLDLILNQEPFPTIDAAGLALIEAQGALALVTAQAGIATAQAVIATTGAWTATTQAGTATTQAGIATTQATTATNAATAAGVSASAASTSADTASTQAATASAAQASATASAATATTQAGLATTNGAAQVALATTQAGYASLSASAALASEGAATTQAGASYASSQAAAVSEGNAATSAGSAQTYAATASSAATASGNSATASEASSVSAGNSASSATSSAATATTQAGVATTQAGTATTQAGIATTQAGIATAGGTTATTQAGIATAQAVIATTGAGTATAQTVIATNQAGIATTQAADASTSATNAAASAASALAIYGTTAVMNGAVASAAANAATATTQATAAGVSASAAAASAAAASTSKDLAISAWAASTAPAETLAAMSQSLHLGAIVKAIIYDTSKDSDGGAWRKRCADKSWYTETLGGDRWIGQRASVGAAWTAAGSATGAVYQSSADGRYYTPLSSSTQTEVFRGISREFPALVAIVAETARVVIYDLTQTGTPMWMVFIGAEVGANWYTSTYMAMVSGLVTMSSVAAMNGTVLLANNAVSGLSGVNIVNFIKDNGYFATNYGGAQNSRRLTVPIGSRNVLSPALADATIVLVNKTVNDVAITVLDTAPIDPSTNLPVCTIAVATAGGVYVILDSGTVRNSSSTAASYGISFDTLNRVVWNTTTAINRSIPCPVGASFAAGSTTDVGLSSSVYSTSNVSIMPAVTSAGGKTTRGAVASANGLTCVKAGQGAANVMIAALTIDYNSGWQVGDIRGAHLADSVAGSITGSGELVTNGTFDTDATGWSATNATLSVVSGAMRVTVVAGGSSGFAYAAITCVVGKTYNASAQFVTDAVSGNFFLNIGTGSGLGNTLSVNGGSVIGVFGGDFVATQTTHYVSLTSSSSAVTADYFDVDNISCKLAEPDRSVKNKGLVVNGTLTKTAVATAAQLVAYSGFSASNYLEQPYNSNLDFSTTGFSGVLWLTEAPNSAIEYLINRDSPTPAAAIRLWVSVAGFLVFELYDGTTTRTATGTVAIDDSTRKCVMFDYSAGTLNIYVNNVLYATATGAALLTLNNAAATLRIGESKAGSQPLTNGSIALVRLSATVMSADQREYIYRTELPLFQANAQCCIAGTSTAVTALAYDEDTDLLHVGTSWGRSGFKDLLRIDSEATTTGALTSLSASGGTVLTGGTSAKVYQPALLLRDELRRKSEARKALGRVVVGKDFVATSGQTAFVCTAGYDVRFVYANGLLKRITTDYTVSDDGFQKTVTFGTGIVLNVPVTIMLTRS